MDISKLSKEEKAELMWRMRKKKTNIIFEISLYKVTKVCYCIIVQRKQGQ